MITDISNLCISPETSLRDTIACLDRSGKGIALVVDPEKHLLGTITDGDIRREIMAGSDLGEPVSRLMEKKKSGGAREPITAREGTGRTELLQLMQEWVVRQVPILDPQGHVTGLATWDDLLPHEAASLQAIVMAGGLGSRLHPHTKDTPKPMLQVGDRPLLERIVGQLKQSGIQQVNITTHYMPEKIREHFGDGHGFGVNIQYVSEDRPLGTAGAVGLMEETDSPLLIVNGDILTDIDFRVMLAFHIEHKADLTVGVRQYDLQVPYGVIENDGINIKQVREKPLYTFFVNAGIYLLDPGARSYIPSGRRFDMTNLIELLIAKGRSVVSFPIIEYWLDIGKPDDYKQAQLDIQNGRIKQ